MTAKDNQVDFYQQRIISMESYIQKLITQNDYLKANLEICQNQSFLNLKP